MSDAALIAARDVVVQFDGGVRAVAGVSLDIAEGETLGLVGESGCGKTTLGRALIALQPLSGGRITYAGRDLATFTRRDERWLRRQAQIIFQDPLSSLSPRFTIRRLLAEPLRIHGLDPRGEWPRVLDLMRQLGLSESLLAKYPHQISGGQARRVGIARALVLQPRFIMADEPTAGLDVSVQGDLLNLMQALQVRFGLTYMIVSHNLRVVHKVTDRVAIMYLGRIVEIGRTELVFAAPAHPYTYALIAASPVIDPERRREKLVLRGEIPSPVNPPPGCRFHTRCPRVQDRCRIEEPPLLADPSGRSFACHFPLTAPAPA